MLWWLNYSNKRTESSSQTQGEVEESSIWMTDSKNISWSLYLWIEGSSLEGRPGTDWMCGFQKLYHKRRESYPFKGITGSGSHSKEPHPSCLIIIHITNMTITKCSNKGCSCICLSQQTRKRLANTKPQWSSEQRHHYSAVVVSFCWSVKFCHSKNVVLLQKNVHSANLS